MYIVREADRFGGLTGNRMLTALHIQDFVLIDSLALTVEPGMTALTGETGAGKSILLEALGLAVGARSSRGGVRRGAQKGVVSAAFEPLADHPVWSVLEANGLVVEDDQIILRRVQSADGRGRAFVNDQPASIGLLREIGGALLEIHGQHDGRGFLTASTHRDLLDEFGGAGAAKTAVRDAWRKRVDAQTRLDELRAARANAEREREYLTHTVDELADLDPKADEEAALAERRSSLMAAEKIADDLMAASAALSDDGTSGRLSAAARRLSRAAGVLGAENALLSDALDKIDRAISETMEAEAAVALAVEKLGHDPEALERAEDRLFALRAAARKHGAQPSQLPELLQKAKSALALLEENAADYAHAEKRLAAADAAYQASARGLSDLRATAAERLDAAVARELAPLKLEKAAFKTIVHADETAAGPDGFDHVEFMVSTNPGQDPGPLKTIASGGELSRFVLAMKAALAAKENRTVIIFDEVDAGVGGAVADAVGERLARLARDAQVLVVTHSPQVAARAHAQWLVEKTGDAREARTLVRALDAPARIEEIGRMLSGAEVTPEARAAAARLLGAQPSAKKPAKQVSKQASKRTPKEAPKQAAGQKRPRKSA